MENTSGRTEAWLHFTKGWLRKNMFVFFTVQKWDFRPTLLDVVFVPIKTNQLFETN